MIFGLPIIVILGIIAVIALIWIGSKILKIVILVMIIAAIGAFVYNMIFGGGDTATALLFTQNLLTALIAA